LGRFINVYDAFGYTGRTVFVRRNTLMIVRLVWLLLTFGMLAGCGNVAGKPLPMVSAKDPTWPLQADHLEYGELPK
jgi:hypothetical protein